MADWEERLRRRVGAAIRQARMLANLSQAELASAIGSDIKTIGRIERGEYAPSLATLVRIADRTGHRLDDLVSRESRGAETEAEGAATGETLFSPSPAEGEDPLEALQADHLEMLRLLSPALDELASGRDERSPVRTAAEGLQQLAARHRDGSQGR